MLTDADFALTYRYLVVPALAGHVTASGVEKLQRRPDVVSVSIIFPVFATLAESVALIHADDPGLQALGLDGTGVNVAVLDSGIANGHADLSGSIIGEECFADCVGGGNRQSGPGSAEDDSNGHGSHVTGIITSDGITTGLSKGVAPGAGIFAYRVLGGPGVGSSESILGGLDHILATTIERFNSELPPLTPLINMSFGGLNGYPAGTCNTDDPLIEGTLGLLRFFWCARHRCHRQWRIQGRYRLARLLSYCGLRGRRI